MNFFLKNMLLVKKFESSVVENSQNAKKSPGATWESKTFDGNRSGVISREAVICQPSMENFWNVPKKLVNQFKN